uniref:BAALC binder of MAP3K1 and KLF4 n=1 Tax=Anolis carolinensis TaxID=28377 RepID=A0A803SY37_ANOCA
MGCGGSRADALEPRYYESWDRGDRVHLAYLLIVILQFCVFSGILEDSKSTQTCIAKSSPASGVTITEKRAHCGTQCAKLTVHNTGASAEKQQNGFRSTEGKRENKKKATKEVAINASKTIRQISSNKRMTKNCVN